VRCFGPPGETRLPSSAICIGPRTPNLISRQYPSQVCAVRGVLRFHTATSERPTSPLRDSRYWLDELEPAQWTSSGSRGGLKGPGGDQPVFFEAYVHQRT